ncbi:unnamed protein product [Clonostachys rosea]|uniref:Uncharacterized protein n=1 Tax=Bionectria ochroleuca TaxID=29856 RepID=A0ABY6UX83_BIOOC|nr:unnamed protein product [Clonostachys rosea]
MPGLEEQYVSVKEEEKDKRHSAKTGELGLGGVPDLEGILVRADEILEVRRHGPAVDLGSGARLAHALGDVEDDAGEALLVDPDLLVVRDFSDFAAQLLLAQLAVAFWTTRGLSYLTSAKCSGRSLTIAPPYRGVLLNSVIFED